MFTRDKFFKARKEIVEILGETRVLTDEISLSLHSFDCSLGRTRPDAVLLINNTKELPSVIKTLNKYSVPFVPRAAATNHVGGCVALKGGVVLHLMGLNRIIRVDTREEFAEVECCVVNEDLNNLLNSLGYEYLPDPASQKICTLGGNAALNAGGAKGLKYGATREHIIKAEIVTPFGEVVTLSNKDKGPDFLGFIIGSEGTLGVITKLWLKISKKDYFIKTMLAAFDTVDESMDAVAAITARGIVPRCIEAMDKTTTVAVESFSKSGYPTDTEALLLIETDGTARKAAKEIKEIEAVCREHNCKKIIIAQNEEKRQALWKGRSGGYAAMARLAPNVFVEDGTVPRAVLPEAIKKTREICETNSITAGLFFHAGDGNLHPNVVFDQRSKQETNLVVKAGKEMLKVCTDLGGTISGEHGVGIEKRSAMSFMYGAAEIAFFKKLKNALDPEGVCNPDKIFPVADKEGAVKDAPKEIKDLSAAISAARGVKIQGLNSNKIKTDRANVSLKNINKILDVDTKNYTITVQAGAKVTDIIKELSAKKLYAALPKYKGSVGGLFAQGLCNEFNSYVTGMQAVLAGGEIINYGGKFVKNSAGYNLARLFAGSEGAFGAVTELTFRIFSEKKAAVTQQKTLSRNPFYQRIKQAVDKNNKFEGFSDE